MAKKATVEKLAPVVGRRKCAVARVQLVPGSGKIVVNGKEYTEYFGRQVLQTLIRQPLVATENDGKYDVLANIQGGGSSGQAGALRHGIARALIEINPELRPVLRQGGYVTRDPRMKERRKYGLKKARKAPQFSKR